MKIIFSPTKEMNLSNPNNVDWKIKNDSRKILNVIEKLTDKEISEFLKVNDSILTQVKEYFSNFNNKKSYRAIDLYNGLSFRTLNPKTLSSDEIKYLEENLLILSALYGPISPLENIKPYRLDFLSSIKIENKSIKSFWKNKFDEYIRENEIIINLASNEFSEIFNQDKYKWVDFEFYEMTNGSRKKHSTISKKGRALLLRYLAENNVNDLKQIKNFNYENYRFCKESTDTKFIFIREV